MITIIDYGTGNLGSIRNMLKKIGVASEIATTTEEIDKAKKLILPGVGTFDNGMESLVEKGFIETLNQKILREGTPVLGICLGMQLMAKSSEEGNHPGLGWIDAHAKKFRFGEAFSDLKVPHMGWNTIEIKKDSGLMKGLSEDSRFYFVHSFHLAVADDTIVLSETRHGTDFVSAFETGNIMGVQFHPEKSHDFGMTLLSNYVRAY